MDFKKGDLVRDDFSEILQIVGMGISKRDHGDDLKWDYVVISHDFYGSNEDEIMNVAFFKVDKEGNRIA